MDCAGMFCWPAGHVQPHSAQNVLFSNRSQPAHLQLFCLSLTSAGGIHLSQHKCVHSSRRLCYWETLAGITARVTTGTDTLTQGFSHESFRVNKGGGDTEMIAFCIVKSKHRNRYQPTNYDVSTQWMLFSNKKKQVTVTLNYMVESPKGMWSGSSQTQESKCRLVPSPPHARTDPRNL